MSAPEKTSRILVVDDDEGLLVLMAEALRDEGHEVATARSGAEARDAIAAQRPELMLLDLNLKDVGGRELVARLAQEDRTVPFIAITGQGDEKVAVEVMKQGALDYVMKDTALLDLLPAVVNQALATIARGRELAESQASLRESEARYSAAITATNDGVWEWQIPEGKVYFSPRWKEILGYAPQEIRDDLAEWKKRVHPEDRARLEQALEQIRENPVAHPGVEYRMRHKEGTYRWVLLRAILVRDEQGQPVRMIGAHTDTTERKQLEKEILAISEREQQRIGQDLHDGLGQQLTAIELMCESLKEDVAALRPDLAAQVARIGGFLREAVTQTRSLAHGLTPFMIDTRGLQVALEELAQRTSSLNRVPCRFVCKAPVEIADDLAEKHLFRIAQEAVANALKHAQADEITLSLSSDGHWVKLEIADNGRGFPKSDKAGHGIGLRVMQHRADAMGADLSMKSTRGRGVRIVCTLRQGK